MNLFGYKLDESIKNAKAAASMVRTYDNNRFHPYPHKARGPQNNLNWKGKAQSQGGGRPKGHYNNNKNYQSRPFQNHSRNTQPPPAPNQANNNNYILRYILRENYNFIYKIGLILGQMIESR